jgi:hypothetical protein
MKRCRLPEVRHPARGAECVLEPPPAPAANCALKFMASRSASGSATASPVSVGPAAFSRRWPASPLPIMSSAPRPSMCALAIEAPGSGSVSRVFRRLEPRSTTVADILGCSCRRKQRRMTRTPSDCAYGSAADPNGSSEGAAVFTPHPMSRLPTPATARHVRSRSLPRRAAFARPRVCAGGPPRSCC